MLEIIYIILATIGIALGFIMCFTMAAFIIDEHYGVRCKTPQFIENYLDNIDKIFSKF